MSAIIVLTPVIIAGWPVIAAAVTAAVGTMGFAAVRSAELGRDVATTSREEIEVNDSEILAAAAGTEEKIVVQREGITASFSRDARGALRVCMEGQGHSKREAPPHRPGAYRPRYPAVRLPPRRQRAQRAAHDHCGQGGRRRPEREDSRPPRISKK